MSPSKLLLLPILLILLLSQIFDISRSETIPELCNASDKSVLLRIKSELGNPPSHASWDPNTDCCVGWRNINCNSQGHVVSISSDEFNDMHGSIPSSFDHLPSLTYLDISDAPNLSGHIPSLGNLTNLTLFLISNTNFTGPIPDFLAHLTNLKTLRLSSIGLTGPIPNLGNLTKLTNFGISNTSITGPIPDFLAHLTNLEMLDLSNNGLTGPIPNFLGRLKNLNTLNLSSNQLTGPIPTVLSELPNLSNLLLSSNKLSGRIPNHLSKLKNLYTINLNYNSLSGPIPDFLGQLPLGYLELSNNQLTGPIPYSFARVDFWTINLAHNKLSGNASFLFHNRSGYHYEILLEYNFLSFDFSNVDVGQYMGHFNISHNMIYGSLPKGVGDLYVDSFDVSYNQLCGPIPNDGHFKRGNPAFFSHNKCLCGGPLPACK